MTDKTRLEFNEYFGGTPQCSTAGIGELYEEACFAVWRSAKEKYEPRWMPVEEDCLRMVFALVDSGTVRHVGKLIPLAQIETSNCNEVARYADQCWRELSATSTQGEE